MSKSGKFVVNGSPLLEEHCRVVGESKGNPLNIGRKSEPLRSKHAGVFLLEGPSMGRLTSLSLLLLDVRWRLGVEQGAKKS